MSESCCGHDHDHGPGNTLGWPIFLVVSLALLVILPPGSELTGWQSLFFHSFLGLLLEALPFLLIAGLMAGLIEVLIPEHLLPSVGRRLGIVGLPVIALCTPLLPLCECGIVGIGRGLLRKGLPIPHCAVYLLAAPILNPIVLLTTWLAFSTRPEVLWIVLGRAAGGLIIPVVIGAVLYRVRPEMVLRADFHGQHDCHHEHGTGLRSGFLRLFDTAREEFSAMAPWFLVGIALATGLKSAFDAGSLGGLGSGLFGGPAMMLLSFLLSLCSEVDAFVAASFSGASPSALVAFLVFGPMIDIRLMMLYRSILRGRAVLAFAAIITLVNLCYALALWGMLG